MFLHMESLMYEIFKEFDEIPMELVFLLLDKYEIG